MKKDKPQPVDLEEFKKKVKVELVGFDPSEEGRKLSQKGDGIIDFAVSERLYEVVYKRLKELGILKPCMEGLKAEFSFDRNLKILINHTEEDKEELWT